MEVFGVYVRLCLTARQFFWILRNIPPKIQLYETNPRQNVFGTHHVPGLQGSWGWSQEPPCSVSSLVNLWLFLKAVFRLPFCQPPCYLCSPVQYCSERGLQTSAGLASVCYWSTMGQMHLETEYSETFIATWCFHNIQVCDHFPTNIAL